MAAALVVLNAACTETRSRPTVPFSGSLAVLSDPPGASIALDGVALPNTTPDTLSGVPSGQHEIELLLSGGSFEAFRWSGEVTVPQEDLGIVEAALQGGCGRDCPFIIDRGRIICRFNGVGDTCASSFFTTMPALQWPGEAEGDFGSGGRLLAAAILEDDAEAQAGDTLATQVFRSAWLGRRPISQSVDGLRQVSEINYWGTEQFVGSSLLGLNVEQTMVAVDSPLVEDILFIHFRVTNISADPLYRFHYPSIPEGGYTLGSLYLGFGLDADVGFPGDDLATFDPDLDLGFIYDGDFNDSEFGAQTDRPALVGVVSLERPTGTAEHIRTLWRSEDDWDDGVRHDFAWRLLAGRLSGADALSDHPDAEIGFVSDELADYRFIHTHGPLRLAPGESVEFAVGLIFAEPVDGAFTSGELVAPGDPTTSNRTILSIAQTLRDLAAQAPEFWDRYRP